MKSIIEIENEIIDGMNDCRSLSLSGRAMEPNPRSPMLRGKPSQSTNQSLFVKANWWLLARRELVDFFVVGYGRSSAIMLRKERDQLNQLFLYSFFIYSFSLFLSSQSVC